MYNRYSAPGGYRPVEPDGPQGEPSRPASGGNAGSGSLFSALGSFLGGSRPGGGLDGLLERLGVTRLDKGDILLILILVYLFRESEDDEWLIILALVLLMGLG